MMNFFSELSLKDAVWETSGILSSLLKKQFLYLLSLLQYALLYVFFAALRKYSFNV